MQAIRKLDNHIKLYASFLVLLCAGALLAVWLLGQLSQMQELTVQLAQKLSGAGLKPAELARAQYGAARNWTMLLLAAGLGLSVALALWLAQEMERPVYEAVDLARKVAGGDLSTRIGALPAGQSGILMRTMQDMNDKLIGMIVEVRGGAEAIASGAGQVASGSLDLSARTEQQAASLEETASSMEELTATVKQNADHAHQASKLAVSASEVAVKGGDVVAEVVGTMASINDSSKRIAEIIGVIDGIAFQTNILALNAAVEAARAGEQGRGFAVVASEVRSLAQRSAAAAREIKALIDDSVDKVSAGTQLADKAGSTMHEVVGSVKRVTEIIAEIAAASAEQTSGLEQVNQAIAAMDQATQSNAALVEQSASAAASMRDQAASLGRVISAFILGPEYVRAPAQIKLISSNPGKPAAARGESRARPKIAPVAVAAVRKAAAPAAGAKRGAAKRDPVRADMDWEEF
jgi:methyl-accepting chemotaxis protein